MRLTAATISELTANLTGEEGVAREIHGKPPLLMLSKDRKRAAKAMTHEADREAFDNFQMQDQIDRYLDSLPEEDIGEEEPNQKASR